MITYVDIRVVIIKIGEKPNSKINHIALLNIGSVFKTC